MQWNTMQILEFLNIKNINMYIFLNIIILLSIILIIKLEQY